MDAAPPKPLVLVVDDDDVTTELYARVLQHIGLDAQTADGHQAMGEVQRLNPSAVIMDLQMPSVDGLTLLRQLRHSRSEQSLPIAIVTGHLLLDAATIDEIRSLGAHVAFKPLFYADVVSLVKTLLPPASTADGA